MGFLLFCSLLSFEAVTPLICHLSLSSHAVQCASAHEQHDLTATQPTHSGKGDQACCSDKAVCYCKFINKPGPVMDMVDRTVKYWSAAVQGLSFLFPDYPATAL